MQVVVFMIIVCSFFDGAAYARNKIIKESLSQQSSKNIPVDSGNKHFQIVPLDSNTSVTSLRREGIETHSFSHNPNPGWSAETNNRIINRSGLTGITNHWDQLEKDILIYRARKSSLSKLTTHYDKIDRTLLKALKKEVEQVERQK